VAARLRVAGDDLSALQRGLETWFASGMDRVTGWYKRHTQLVLLLIGVALAFALNADTISIAEYLSLHPTARQTLSAQAVQQIQAGASQLQAGPSGNQKATTAVLGVIVGMPSGGHGVVWQLIGYLLTACAVSLGAPFWFDLLGKLVALRAAGPAPRTDTTAAAGKQAPPPAVMMTLR